MGRADGGWCLGNVLGVLQIDPPMLRRENNCSFFEQSSVDLDQASLLARLILKLRLIASGALHGGANETAKSSELALVVSASRLAG
jgi:hypothetical protein